MATLEEVRDRVRATANVGSTRLGDDRLNEIINDAVREIASTSRLNFSEKSLTVTLADGVSDYQPADSAGPIEKPVLWTYTSSTDNMVREIKQTTIEGLRSAAADPALFADATVPFVYAVWGSANGIPILRVWPTPTDDLDTTLDCRISFFELEDDDDENDVTNYAYDAVTYLTLLLASAYLENDDRAEVWDRQYSRAFKRLKLSHGSARISGSARRSMKEPG